MNKQTPRYSQHERVKAIVDSYWQSESETTPVSPRSRRVDAESLPGQVIHRYFDSVPFDFSSTDEHLMMEYVQGPLATVYALARAQDLATHRLADMRIRRLGDRIDDAFGNTAQLEFHAGIADEALSRYLGRDLHDLPQGYVTEVRSNHEDPRQLRKDVPDIVIADGVMDVHGHLADPRPEVKHMGVIKPFVYLMRLLYSHKLQDVETPILEMDEMPYVKNGVARKILNAALEADNLRTLSKLPQHLQNLDTLYGDLARSEGLRVATGHVHLRTTPEHKHLSDTPISIDIYRDGVDTPMQVFLLSSDPSVSNNFMTRELDANGENQFRFIKATAHGAQYLPEIKHFTFEDGVLKNDGVYKASTARKIDVDIGEQPKTNIRIK